VVVTPLDLIGQPVLRREDRRFLVGQGRYVSDVPIGSALSVVVVRSPHAHASIERIDLDAAVGCRG
jgi:carbon-monoxide dehydrogenase large subunit